MIAIAALHNTCRTMPKLIWTVQNTQGPIPQVYVSLECIKTCSRLLSYRRIVCINHHHEIVENTKNRGPPSKNKPFFLNWHKSCDVVVGLQIPNQQEVRKRARFSSRRSSSAQTRCFWRFTELLANRAHYKNQIISLRRNLSLELCENAR